MGRSAGTHHQHCRVDHRSRDTAARGLTCASQARCYLPTLCKGIGHINFNMADDGSSRPISRSNPISLARASVAPNTMPSQLSPSPM